MIWNVRIFRRRRRPGFGQGKSPRIRPEGSPAPPAQHLFAPITRHSAGRRLTPRRAGLGGTGFGPCGSHRAHGLAGGPGLRGRIRSIWRCAPLASSDRFPGREGVPGPNAAHATEPWQAFDTLQMLHAEVAIAEAITRARSIRVDKPENGWVAEGRAPMARARLKAVAWPFWASFPTLGGEFSKDGWPQ